MLCSHRLLCLVAAFLVPNSQALISNPVIITVDTPGYHCRLNTNLRMINIHYGNNAQGLPCQVTHRENTHAIRQLLEAKRNINICESKATDMAARLRDRGWRCEQVGIAPYAVENRAGHTLEPVIPGLMQ